MNWSLPPAEPEEQLDQALTKAMDRVCRPLAPGVEGVTVDRPGDTLEVSAIRATTPRIPGAVGLWLDDLPRDRPVYVPWVVSDRLARMLARMLARRGFVDLGPDQPSHFLRLP